MPQILDDLVGVVRDAFGFVQSSFSMAVRAAADSRVTSPANSQAATCVSR